MITLTSIPGSGTHFCKDHLLPSQGWRRCNRDPKPREIERYGNKLFHFEHIFPHTLDTLDLELTTLIPLRHPMSVAQTWANRGGNREPAIRKDRERGKRGMYLVNLYRLLIDVVDKWNPFYLPVDSPNRDRFLAEFNEGLGTNFTTDWRIIRNGGCSKFDMDEEDRGSIEMLIADPFFRRFGY